MATTKAARYEKARRARKGQERAALKARALEALDAVRAQLGVASVGDPSDILAHAVRSPVAAALRQLEGVYRDAGWLPPLSRPAVKQATITLAKEIDACGDLYRKGQQEEAVARLYIAIETGPWEVRARPDVVRALLARHFTPPLARTKEDRTDARKKRAPTGKRSTAEIVVTVTAGVLEPETARTYASMRERPRGEHGEIGRCHKALNGNTPSACTMQNIR